MRRYLFNRRVVLALVAAIIFTTTIYWTFFCPTPHTAQIYYFFNPLKAISCFHYDPSVEHTLEDISLANVRKGRSIFFHETSCRSKRNGKITLLRRQACAVESAAKMNPDMDIYLTFSSPGIFKFEDNESDHMLQRLLEYDNIQIKHLNYQNYTKGTPLETIYSDGKLDSSLYAMSHASDVLRYLTLYKYGGIYLDLDVIVIKSLEGLRPNYAGIESRWHVAAGVLSFDAFGKGHEYAKRCVMDLKEHFSSYSWGSNGPGVITRLLRNICGTEDMLAMSQRDCQNFTVYAPNMFYAIPYGEWELYFDGERIDEVMNITKYSYVLHFWNKFSEPRRVPKGDKTPYTIFAEEYCPMVYKECDTYF